MHGEYKNPAQATSLEFACENRANYTRDGAAIAHGSYGISYFSAFEWQRRFLEFRSFQLFELIFYPRYTCLRVSRKSGKPKEEEYLVFTGI